MDAWGRCMTKEKRLPGYGSRQRRGRARRLCAVIGRNRKIVFRSIAMDITHITSLLGGVALFLYGMSIMGAGLEKLA